MRRMIKVARWTPTYLFPCIDFSTEVPYVPATLWSLSATRVNSKVIADLKDRIHLVVEASVVGLVGGLEPVS